MSTSFARIRDVFLTFNFGMTAFDRYLKCGASSAVKQFEFSGAVMYTRRSRGGQLYERFMTVDGGGKHSNEYENRRHKV